MLFIFAKCDFSWLFFRFVSDIVFLRDMDVCDNEIPVTAVNELNNEMPVTAVNELPETSADDMEKVQDRHVVNGELYASRAARTVFYDYPPQQQRALYSENVMPQRPRTAFLHQARTQRPSRSLKLLRKPKLTRRRSHVCNRK